MKKTNLEIDLLSTAYTKKKKNADLTAKRAFMKYLRRVQIPYKNDGNLTLGQFVIRFYDGYVLCFTPSSEVRCYLLTVPNDHPAYVVDKLESYHRRIFKKQMYKREKLVPCYS